VKRKVVSGVLAVIGLLALATTVAQAGGGGTPFPLTSFFVCNSINGGDAGLVVDIVKPFISPARQGVRIGNAALACAVAKLFRSGTTTEIEPNSSNGPDLKCYSVSVSPRNSGSPPPSYTATDDLFAGTDTGIHDTGIQYICGPAGFLRE